MRIAAASSTVAYAWGDFSGLERTDDGGRTWRRMLVSVGATHADSRLEVATLAVAPSAPEVVYAVTRDDGGGMTLHRSADAGGAWKAIGPMPQGEVRVLVVDPADSNRLYAGGGGFDFATSADGGQHWTQATEGLPAEVSVTTLAVRPTTPRTLYAGTLEHGVFASTDGGAIWSPASDGLPRREGVVAILALALDAVAPNVLHALTERQGATGSGYTALARSTDGGATWRVRRTGGYRLRALVAHPTVGGTLLGASDGDGVLRSADRGEHWQLANAGLTAVVPAALAVDPAKPRAVYLATNNGSGLRRTSDGGGTWSPAPGRPAYAILDVVLAGQPRSSIYVATGTRGVLRSRDGGRTWAEVNRGLGDYRNAVSDLEVAAGKRPALYAAANRHPDRSRPRIFKSVDAGASWRRIGVSITPRRSDVARLAVSSRQPATVFAAVNDRRDDSAGVFVSRDAGKTWKRRGARLPPGPPGTWLWDLAVATTGDIFVAGFSPSSRAPAEPTPSVHRLGPSAARWTRVVAGLPRSSNRGRAHIWTLGMRPRTNALYVGTERGLYVLERAKDGFQWRSATRALNGESVRSLAFAADGSRLYAATEGRFFVRRWPGRTRASTNEGRE